MNLFKKIFYLILYVYTWENKYIIYKYIYSAIKMKLGVFE